LRNAGLMRGSLHSRPTDIHAIAAIKKFINRRVHFVEAPVITFGASTSESGLSCHWEAKKLKVKMVAEFVAKCAQECPKWGDLLAERPHPITD
jgi:hypothetical protein